MRNVIRSKFAWIAIAAGAGFLAALSAQTSAPSKHKPLHITRLYTGPDGLTHAEEVEARFLPGKNNDVSKMMSVSGAELHRAAPGTVIDWHTAPRRQYVITLSGRGEVEVAGGKKILLEPGHIDLVEDTTGKGHITRVLGSEDRVTLQLPVTDQTGH